MADAAPNSPNRSNRGRQRLLRLLAFACIVFAAMTVIVQTSAWSLLELRSFDYLSTFNHPKLSGDAPVIVAIDEPSFAEINSQWPWPRSLHARLIAQLRAAGAKVIGLDIVFAEPSTPENDAALAAALGPDVVLAGDETLIASPQGDQLVRAEPLPQFTATGAVTGIASISLDADGTFRRIPHYADGFAAKLAEAAGASNVQSMSGMLAQAFGPSRTYPTASYYQALDPKTFLPEGYFRDRVVIVGLSLQNPPAIQAGGSDAFATPYTVHTAKLVYGAEVQATIADNLMRNLAIGRPGPLVVLALTLAATAIGALTVMRGTGWRTAVAGLFIGLGFIVASYLLLRFGREFVSPAAPILAFASVVVGQAALDYAEERRNRKQVTRAFSQYISPVLVERLAEDSSHLKLGGELRTLSILFSDVRGFTTIAETLKNDPQHLTTLINRLLTPLSDVVFAHGGTIDKYIGDCIMAFWNAPLDDPDHAVNAVAAGLDMLAAIEVLNAELKREAEATGAPFYPLKVGVGINTGDCVVGNMGSSRRFDYSALGDAVNLASRLEGTSKNYGVSLLIGEETARQVAEKFTVLELDRVTVKGRTTASPVYTVVNGVPADHLQEHQGFLDLRYAGTLAAEDAIFDRLSQALPALAGYYGLARQQIVGGGA